MGLVVPSNHAYPGHPVSKTGFCNTFLKIRRILTSSHFPNSLKALPPETFEINRLLGTKSLPPPSAIASHPDKSLIAALGSPTASKSETKLISIEQKPGLTRQKTAKFPGDVKGMLISWFLQNSMKTSRFF
jgi:hypothetical protein